MSKKSKKSNDFLNNGREEINSGHLFFNAAPLSYDFFERFPQFDKLSFPLVFLKPFKVLDEDFRKPINNTTGKEFPYCCTQCYTINHKLGQKFEKFPNCCSLHQKASKEPWFNAEDYINLPDRVLICLFSTINHINKNINEDDWFGDISEFIELNIVSFGIPTICPEWYLKNLILCLGNFDNIHINPMPEYKRNRLISHVKYLIKSPTSSEEKQKEKSDFNLLLTTYKKWLEFFPNLEYFKEFKEQAKKDFLEIATEKKVINPYFPIFSKRRLLSPKELLNILIDLTIKTTRLINTKTLIENDNLSEAYAENLIDENHRLRQMKLGKEFSKKEKKYAEYLKKWLENEKEYFLEKREALKNRKIREKKFTAVAKRKEKKPSTLLDFFNDNPKKVEIFIAALSKTENSNGLAVIDENKKWLWKPQNSVCNCLEALFRLSENSGGGLVNHSLQGQYADLHQMMLKEFKIKCVYNNFKNWGNNIEQIRIFKNKFKIAFQEFL